MDDTDRRGLRILDRAECLRRLREVPVGRLGFTLEGAMVILPVNYVLRDDRICFKTTWGSKLRAVAQQERVVFEVDDYRSGSRLGWSILARATPSMVEDPGVRAELDATGMMPWAPLTENAFWVQLHLDRLDGREILPAV